LLDSEMSFSPVSLSQPLIRVETSVKPAVEAMPIMNGQSVDRFFASIGAQYADPAIRALRHQADEPPLGSGDRYASLSANRWGTTLNLIMPGQKRWGSRCDPHP
jgi:hypothetical protein